MEDTGGNYLNRSSTARVFVIQDNGTRDFSPALRFGKLVPILERDAFPDDARERVKAMNAIIRRKLKGFNPYSDYVLLTGDPVAILLVGKVIASMPIIRKYNLAVKLLKWDRENRGYYVVST